jgi:CBS domain-containing protein
MKIKVAMKSPMATVEPGATVERAETLLANAGTCALPVVEAGRLVGLVHRRDLLRVRPSSVPALARYEWAASSSRLRVGDVMRRDFVTVTPEADVHEVARTLSSREAEAVPVVDGGEVVGLLSVRECLTVLVRELEQRWPPRLSRVLASVGAGDRATPALPAAVALARHHQARLILLHVMPPLGRLAAEVGQDLMDRVAAQRRAYARQWLTSLVPEEVDVTVTVAESDEVTEVVATATRDAVDLIVAEAAIARAIAQQAPCPVLAVPPARIEHARR